MQRVFAGEHRISASLINKLVGPPQYPSALPILTKRRRIKAVRPDMRIILISACPDREFHRHGLQSGAVTSLGKKDLALPTLRQVIDDMIV